MKENALFHEVQHEKLAGLKKLNMTMGMLTSSFFMENQYPSVNAALCGQVIKIPKIHSVQPILIHFTADEAVN